MHALSEFQAQEDRACCQWSKQTCTAQACMGVKHFDSHELQQSEGRAFRKGRCSCPAGQHWMSNVCPDSYCSFILKEAPASTERPDFQSMICALSRIRALGL